MNLHLDIAAFCNATEDLLLIPALRQSRFTVEERELLQVYTNSLRQLVASGVTNASARQSKAL
jgi:hypothetical protein